MLGIRLKVCHSLDLWKWQEIREGARRKCYKKNIYLAVPRRKVAN